MGAATDRDGTTPASRSRATRRRWIVMTFLCVLSFLTYFDRICIVRAQESIERDLGLSPEQMGLVLGAFFLAYALFEVPGGWMGDRWGTRITLTRIVLAWSVFTAASGAATGFTSLLVYRFLFGVGEAGAYPNMARVQQRWLPVRSRGRAGGMLWFTARLGGAFSPLLFGMLLRSFDAPEFRAYLPAVGLPSDLPAWRVAFWAAGLVGLVWCLAFFPWFRDDPADVRSVNDAELRLIREGRSGEPQGHSMPWPIWRQLLCARGLWAMGLLYVFGSFGWSFFISWMPRFLKDVHGVEFEDSEIMSGLPLFCGAFACLLGGILSDVVVKRLGRRRLGRAIFPVCGYIVAAGAMFGLRYADSSYDAAVLMCVAAAAFDFGQGANWATIVDMGGRYAGTAAGFVNMVGNLGGFAQPYIGAKIFQSAGWDALMALYAVMFLLAASMWLFIDPNRTFYGAATTELPEPDDAVTSDPART
jgi:ACS family glucarate transporter-like MFS transporter